MATKILFNNISTNNLLLRIEDEISILKEKICNYKTSIDKISKAHENNNIIVDNISMDHNLEHHLVRVNIQILNIGYLFKWLEIKISMYSNEILNLFSEYNNMVHEYQIFQYDMHETLTNNRSILQESIDEINNLMSWIKQQIIINI